MNVAAVETHCRELTPCLLSTLRIVTAFLLMRFGTAKLFAFPGPTPVMPPGFFDAPGEKPGGTKP